MTTTFDRRKFMAAVGGTAVTAVAAGVGGEMLIKKRPRTTTSAAAAPPAGGSAANGSAASGSAASGSAASGSAASGSAASGSAASGSAASAPTLPYKPIPIAPMTPLPADQTLTMPGLSPFYTPNSKFYRVDTALVVPQVAAQTWQLRIHGMVDRPMVLTYEQLAQLPMIQHDVTLTCVSDAVGGGYIGNAQWQGTLLADVLRKAGIQSGAEQIVMRDVKGMTIGVATEPVMDGRESLLAVGMNGQPLPAEHGYPVRVVVPGLYGYVSATKWVVDMEFTTFGAFDAYWVKQGWSQRAPIKTESRIDVPKDRRSVAAGQVTIAGVAWAQHKGIAGVEVGVDGIWSTATIPAQDTIDTWRQWYYIWEATPGEHVLQVRATDQTGHTQTGTVHPTVPSGATGYHTINVTVV